MSSVRKIPSIKTVQVTLAASNHTLSSSKELYQQLSPSSQAIYQQTTSLHPVTASTISSTVETRQTAQIFQQKALQLAQQAQLSLTETSQTLAAVAAAPFVNSNPQLIQEAFQPLKTANTLATVESSLNHFNQVLETQHQQLLIEKVVLACTNASLKTGFTPIPSSGQIVNGTVRLIANDSEGRSLTTEISSNPDHDLAMATEVIGLSDNRCEEILDLFEEALKQEGVNFSEPERKFTGGICELEAAKEFVRKRPTKQTLKEGSQSSSKSQKKPHYSTQNQSMKPGF